VSSSGVSTTFTIDYGQGSAELIPGPSPCIACTAGTFAKEVQASACAECVGGTYASSAGVSACTACSIGTYTAGKGAQTCVACPANSNNSAPGSGTRNDCTCSFGYVRSTPDFSLPTSECLPCNPNFYCSPLYSTMVPCPANTRSPALSSRQDQCRCVAGYRCTYTRDASLHVDFPDSLDLPAQAGAIQSTLAAAAGVPASGVTYSAKRIYITAPPPGPPPSAEF